MNTEYSILIGSVDDDSHSIGMMLLEIAFRDAGFAVKNLGILNELDDFFFNAKSFDAILISCLNGHSDLYLKDFPYKKSMFMLSQREPKVLFIGGNLSVRDPAETVIRRYLDMGFDYVAPRPVAIETIMEKLEKHFYLKNIKKKKIQLFSKESHTIPFSETVTDEKLTDKEFSETRKEIINSWNTGLQVLHMDVKKNHSFKGKNLHHLIQNQQKVNSVPLIQHCTGVAHTKDVIEILKHLKKNGLDVSSIQLDSASRKNMYNMAEEGLIKTIKGEPSYLNGYPVPVHGVKGVEEIVQAIERSWGHILHSD